MTPHPRVQSVRHGAEAWGKELEEAGHAASSLRKQKELNAGAQLSFFFIYFGTPVQGVVLPTWTVGLPTSPNPSETCPETCFHGDSKCHQIGN